VNRARIGLSVIGSTVSAAVVRRGAVVWVAHAELAADYGVATTVASVLGRCVGVKGARVVAALGKSYARVKRLHGLERVARGELALRAVQQNPDRFFLSSARWSAVSQVTRHGPAWYAAVFAADTVSAIADGCAQAGATLELTVPASDALADELRNGAPVVPPSGYEQYAEAYTAALVRDDAALALSSDARQARGERRRRMSRAALIATAVFAGLANVFAPTIAAELRRRDMTAALVQARDSLRPVVGVMSDLSRTSTALGDIERFNASRRSLLRVLESLAAELPESTAVMSLRADTVNATIVMITRAGPALLQSVARVHDVTNPQVLGAFSREDVGGVPFDRVAVRARFGHATRAVNEVRAR
jgi:hypothetical protein